MNAMMVIKPWRCSLAARAKAAFKSLLLLKCCRENGSHERISRECPMCIWGHCHRNNWIGNTLKGKKSLKKDKSWSQTEAV